MKVAPSILSANLQILGRVENQSRLDSYRCMDDTRSNLTLGPNIVEADYVRNDLDRHLMVQTQNASFHTKSWADYISVHVKQRHISTARFKRLKQKAVKAGVVINPGTPVSAISAVLSDGTSVSDDSKSRIWRSIIHSRNIRQSA